MEGENRVTVLPKEPVEGKAFAIIEKQLKRKFVNVVAKRNLLASSIDKLKAIVKFVNLVNTVKVERVKDLKILQLVTFGKNLNADDIKVLFINKLLKL